MADRGRDLKFSILTDLERFDTDQASRKLEGLADDAKASGDKLDTLADDARRTASKVDDAFDAIARSSRTNLRQKLDDDTDKARASLRDFNDEARDSAREAAASFSGTAGDVSDLGQEILANAPAVFGPAGLAIGAALAGGFGAVYAKWTETKEKIKEQAGEIAQALIDSNGLIDKAFVESKLQQFVQDGTLSQLAQQANDAGINVRDFVRAMAGDPAALERVNADLDESQRQFGLNAAGSINAADAIGEHNRKLDAIRSKLGITTEAVRAGTSAYQVYRDAVSQPVTPRFNGTRAFDQARAYNQELDRIARSLTTTVKVDLPYTALAHFKRELQQIQSGRYRP